MVSYVRIVPELAIHQQFDYAIPVHLQGRLRLGHRVRVPWGKKTIFGYVVQMLEIPQVPECRDVIDIIGENPLIPEMLCELATWISDYYCCPFSLVLKTLLPPQIKGREDAHKTALWVNVAELFDRETVAVQLKRSPAQLKAWLYAHSQKEGWLTEFCETTDTTHAVWRALEKKGLVQLSKKKVERLPIAEVAEETDAFQLNHHQQKALQAITEAVDKGDSKPFLLQGVTGSGKTEVYLQALHHTLKQGKNGIILVPEIALTPQTVNHFRARFEAQNIRVAIMHSQLSGGERHDQWQQIRNGIARVVIGTRSAIFTPVQNLGLIIIDEEHEISYKQEEMPHYHGRDVAIIRAKREEASIVLGTATPSMESAWNVRQGKYTLLSLPERIDHAELPTIHVVDLRKQKMQGQAWLSGPLEEAILQRIEKKQQSILFLNRRGFSTMIQCPSCGHTETCDHCSVSLIYHRADGMLRCHLCNLQRPIEPSCPECRFEGYKHSGAGTQKIEDIVEKTFPHARWQRMDSDNMRGKHVYQKSLAEVRDGKIDILIGTQMIAKGLHFPNVTCVGVIQIDQALQMPDFRAAERVFQQLVQVAGRAGRGNVRGEVYIQCYTPFHPTIQFARHHDVDGFIEHELEYRQAHQFPPFSRAALIIFRGKTEEKTLFCFDQLIQKLRSLLPAEIEVPDPTPAPIARSHNEYRFHVLICTQQILSLSRLLRKEVVDVKWPKDIRASVVIDPYNLY